MSTAMTRYPSLHSWSTVAPPMPRAAPVTNATRPSATGHLPDDGADQLLEQDAAGHHKYLGYIVQIGPWTIYHSGDTVLYEGMVEQLRYWPIDIALLPINGRAPERRVAGNLDGPEAAQLAKAIGAKVVIPCHYEMFEFNTASPADFVAAAQRIDQPYRVLRAGERWHSQTA